jgi:hypothetical protein
MVSRYFVGKGKIFPARTMDAYKASFVSEWLSVVSFTHWPFFHRELTLWYPLTRSLVVPYWASGRTEAKHLLLLPGIALLTFQAMCCS